MEKAKNILFIPSGSIGDALMMLALCDEIIARTPEVKITISVRKNAQLIRDLSLKYAAIKVVPVKKTLGGVIEAVWTAIKKPYAILMPVPFGVGFGKSSQLIFTFLSLRPGAYTAGLLKRKDDRSGYDKAIVYDQSRTYIDNCRILARAVGISVASEYSPVHLDLQLVRPSNSPAADAYLVLHFFGSNVWKSFPPSRCRDLLETLTKKYPEKSFIITGAKENKAEADTIAADLPRTSVLVGAPILEVAWLIQNSALYIGVDTGITHLAGVLHKETVLLGHNATPTWLPTYNPNARILISSTGHAHDIADNEIETAVESFLHAKF